MSKITVALAGDSLGQDWQRKKEPLGSYIGLGRNNELTLFRCYSSRIVVDDITTNLLIFDTDENDQTMSFPSRINVVLITFGMQSPSSFDQVLSTWSPKIKADARTAGAPILLVGLKPGISRRDEYNGHGKSITTSQGEALAKDIGARAYLECLTKEDAKNVFETATRIALKSLEEEKSLQSPQSSATPVAPRVESTQFQKPQPSQSKPSVGSTKPPLPPKEKEEKIERELPKPGSSYADFTEPPSKTPALFRRVAQPKKPVVAKAKSTSDDSKPKEETVPQSANSGGGPTPMEMAPRGFSVASISQMLPREPAATQASVTELQVAVEALRQQVAAQAAVSPSVAAMLNMAPADALQHSLDTSEAKLIEQQQQLRLSQSPFVDDFYLALQIYWSQIYTTSQVIANDQVEQNHVPLQAVGQVASSRSVIARVVGKGAEQIPVIGAIVKLLTATIHAGLSIQQMRLASLFLQVATPLDATPLFETLARLYCLVHFDTLSQRRIPHQQPGLKTTLAQLKQRAAQAVTEIALYDNVAMREAGQTVTQWLQTLQQVLKKNPQAMNLRERDIEKKAMALLVLFGESEEAIQTHLPSISSVPVVPTRSPAFATYPVSGHDTAQSSEIHHLRERLEAFSQQLDALQKRHTQQTDTQTQLTQMMAEMSTLSNQLTHLGTTGASREALARLQSQMDALQKHFNDDEDTQEEVAGTHQAQLQLQRQISPRRNQRTKSTAQQRLDWLTEQVTALLNQMTVVTDTLGEQGDRQGALEAKIVTTPSRNSSNSRASLFGRPAAAALRQERQENEALRQQLALQEQRIAALEALLLVPNPPDDKSETHSKFGLH